MLNISFALSFHSIGRSTFPVHTYILTPYYIHCFLTEGGLSGDGVWRKVAYFNYSYLRKSFQTVLLNKLEKRVGPSFKKMKTTVYHRDRNGFYVYAIPNLYSSESIIKYISHYLGRPVITLSGIDSYNGEMMTFHYNKHEGNSFVQKTLPAIDFIELLILYIPEKNFRMIRYYELYARHWEIDNQLHEIVPKSKHRTLLDFSTWRKLFPLTMGYSPLQCPNCRREMVFLELYRKHERVPLDGLCKRTRHGLYPRPRSAWFFPPSASYYVYHRWEAVGDESKMYR